MSYIKLCNNVNEQLMNIIEGISNKESIICGLMLPNSPLDVFDQDNADDEHVIIEFNHFLGKGTFTDAIIGLARIYNDDINDITLLRYLELYHWGGFLAVPIEWTAKIKALINKLWLKCLKEEHITTKNITSYESLLDDELASHCPLPLNCFNYVCKNTELYWQCKNDDDCKFILYYNKKNPTVQQHIWFTCQCEYYKAFNWYDDEPLNNRSCKLIFEGSISVGCKLIGKDGKRYLPDTIRGSLTLRKCESMVSRKFNDDDDYCYSSHYDYSDCDYSDCDYSDIDSEDNHHGNTGERIFIRKLGGGITRYLPDTVSGDLTLNYFNYKIGEGVTRYLPDRVGGSLELSKFNNNVGEGVTRYLPDRIGGSLELRKFNNNVGEGVTRYLPDRVGGSLDLRKFNNNVGKGVTRYLPDTIGDNLYLRKFNNNVGEGVTRYLPDRIGGSLELRKFNNNVGDGITRYLPDTIGDNLYLNKFNKEIGSGTTRYLPDTIRGSLELQSFNKEIGSSTTRYLPDTIGNSFKMGSFNNKIGEGATRYLPDSIGEKYGGKEMPYGIKEKYGGPKILAGEKYQGKMMSDGYHYNYNQTPHYAFLSLTSLNNDKWGDGTTRYLPDFVVGQLHLDKDCRFVSNDELYFPYYVGGSIWMYDKMNYITKKLTREYSL
jgi:hypothetical protein